MGLTNSQYNSIMRSYDDIHHLHQREQADRLRAIYAECPQLESLHSEITVLSAAMARLRLSASGDYAETAAKRAALIAKRDEIIAAHSYDLSLHYSCPDCKDTGYVGSRKCHCFLQKSIDVRYEQSGIVKALLKKQCFATFDLNVYSPAPNPLLGGKSNREHMQGILSYCLRYIDDFPSDKKSLLIFGPTGVGKTFLINCIAGALLEKDFTVVYTSAAGLYDVAVRRQADPENCLDMDEYFYECDLLIIDDLGAENLSAFKKSYLLKLINFRLNRNAPSIISTNLNPDELQDYYDERISSRLVGMYEPIPILGGDSRIARR